MMGSRSLSYKTSILVQPTKRTGRFYDDVFKNTRHHFGNHASLARNFKQELI